MNEEAKVSITCHWYSEGQGACSAVIHGVSKESDKT